MRYNISSFSNRFSINHASVLIIAVLVLFGFSLSAYAENSAGELEITDQNGQRQMALLLDTEISGRINGMIASINVRQTFLNDTADWVNGRYVFPLPEGAAVDSLRIDIGERTIVGEIKEKEAAKKVFEQAKKTGKKAGLLQQHRPNLFSISVANIAPHEEVIAHITFIDKVRYQDDTFSLSLPTTLTPRYIPGAPIKLAKEVQAHLEAQLMEQNQLDIDVSTGWSANTTQVSDASDITPPQTYSVSNRNTHRFSLNLSLNAGLPLQTVASTSHQLSTYYEPSGQVEISLSNGSELMNSDLVLTWQTVVGNTPQAALFQQKYKGAYYSMLLLTPPQINTHLALPRDITFIIDSSGSMAGGSMEQAKQALHDGLAYLTTNDRFNIVDFDSSFKPLFNNSQNVTATHIQQAHTMINRLHADGGTEMMGALEFALKSPSQEGYLKQVVFITDGAIGNESELFKLINNELHDTRLFTVGIGSAPNAYFMNKAAKFGRGSYTTINNLNQVNSKMANLFSKIMHPVLRDVAVNWSSKVEQYPSRIPDLYAGQPLTLLLKSEQPLSSAEVSGTMLNTPWQQSLKLTASGHTKQPQANNLNTVWAREKITHLMDKLATGEAPKEVLKPQITKLGLTHRLVTKFTSFVAVEKKPSRPTSEQAKHKDIPNLMPKGSAMPVPNTATPAMLYVVIGGVLIMLSRLIRRRSKITWQSRDAS